MPYLISLGEQGLASILNLGVNLWLIRRVGAAEYGAFILWSNISLILSSGQNALTIAHLMALPPGRQFLAQRAEPERVLLSVTLAILLAAGVFGLVSGIGAALPEAGLFLPAFLVNQYARALAFSRGQVLTATVQTGTVLLISVVLFGGSQLLGLPVGAGAAMAMLSLAYGGVGVAGVALMSVPVVHGMGLRDLVRYRRYLGESRWTLLGVTATEFLGRFYSLIVTAWFGTAALGVLSAAQVLLRPAILAVNAWGWVARAEMAGRREAEDRRGFLLSLGRGLAGTVLISVPWGTTVYLAWPLVSQRLYGGRYADAGWIALLWGFSAAGGGLLAAMSTAFQALRAFRVLAYADLAGAAVSVVATVALLSVLSYPFSLVGMMTGQLLEVILLAFLLISHLPKQHS